MAQTYIDANELKLIKLRIGSADYYVKDNAARLILDNYASTNCAAEKQYATSVTDTDTTLPTSKAVKTYVDNAVAAIHNFDIVVCPADAAQIPAGAEYIDGETKITGTMAASASTMYKIYMVKNSKAGSGAYSEYLTLRHGAGTEADPYTYSWEMIGSTVVDLSDYVKKTTTIAGLALTTNIAKADLQSALDLKALAYKDNATGSVETIDSITMKSLSSTGSATITTKSTTISSSGTFKPEGSIEIGATTGAEVVNGVTSMTVTLSDADATATFSTTSYTPCGSTEVTYEKATSAALAVDADNGVQITGTVAAPNITVNPASSTVKVLDVAGTDYTLSGGNAVLSGGSTTTVAANGVTATTTLVSDKDYQITFSDASTTTVVSEEGSVTYTEPKLVGALPTFKDAAVVTGITSATASNPTFTGGKFKIELTNTATTQTFTLSGTSATIINPEGSITYKKASINTATITLATTKLGFTGTSGNVNVTGNYDKVDSTASVTVSGTPEVDTLTKTAKTVTVS